MIEERFQTLKSVNPGLSVLCAENSTGEWIWHCEGFPGAYDNEIDIVEDYAVYINDSRHVIYIL